MNHPQLPKHVRKLETSLCATSRVLTLTFHHASTRARAPHCTMVSEASPWGPCSTQCLCSNRASDTVSLGCPCEVTSPSHPCPALVPPHPILWRGQGRVQLAEGDDPAVFREGHQLVATVLPEGQHLVNELLEHALKGLCLGLQSNDKGFCFRSLSRRPRGFLARSSAPFAPLASSPARTAHRASSPGQCSQCRPSHSETRWRERPRPSSPLQTAETPEERLGQSSASLTTRPRSGGTLSPLMPPSLPIQAPSVAGCITMEGVQMTCFLKFRAYSRVSF